MRGKPLKFICEFEPDEKRMIAALRFVLSKADEYPKRPVDPAPLRQSNVLHQHQRLLKITRGQTIGQRKARATIYPGGNYST